MNPEMDPELIIELCKTTHHQINKVKEASKELYNTLYQLNAAITDERLHGVVHMASEEVFNSIDYSMEKMNQAECLIHDIANRIDEIMVATSSHGSWTL